MKYIEAIRAMMTSLPAPPDFEFRMNRTTFDQLAEVCHAPSDTVHGLMYGVPVKIWAWVPDGEVWRVSRELLKNLGESS